jgi:hypothetical protein
MAFVVQQQLFHNLTMYRGEQPETGAAEDVMSAAAKGISGGHIDQSQLLPSDSFADQS